MKGCGERAFLWGWGQNLRKESWRRKDRGRISSATKMKGGVSASRKLNIENESSSPKKERGGGGEGIGKPSKTG